VEIVFYAFDHVNIEVNHEFQERVIDPSVLDFHFDMWESDTEQTINYLLFLDVAKSKKQFACSPYRISASFLVQIAFPQPDLFAVQDVQGEKHRTLLEGAGVAYCALQAAISTFTRGCLNGEIAIPDTDLSQFIRYEE